MHLVGGPVHRVGGLEYHVGGQVHPVWDPVHLVRGPVHPEAGGFIELAEVQAVEKISQQMEAIHILYRKTNADFTFFCKMLQQSSYSERKGR